MAAKALLAVIVALSSVSFFAVGSYVMVPSTPARSLRFLQFELVTSMPARLKPYFSNVASFEITTFSVTKVPSMATPCTAASKTAPVGWVTEQFSRLRAAMVQIEPCVPVASR